MKPHKHAELIKAWADGAEIEYRMSETEKWVQLDSPSWFADEEYRIKSKPKPDVASYFRSENYQLFYTIHHKEASLKVKWDSETGELKSAEVLK